MCLKRLANTAVVASRCELELTFGKSILPSFRPIPEHLTAGDYLQELCRQGLEQRYGISQSGMMQSHPMRKQAEERLAYELGVIEKMGFSDYFLIVWDFIRFAHENRIMTGPGGDPLQEV